MGTLVGSKSGNHTVQLYTVQQQLQWLNDRINKADCEVCFVTAEIHHQYVANMLFVCEIQIYGVAVTHAVFLACVQNPEVEPDLANTQVSAFLI